MTVTLSWSASFLMANQNNLTLRKAQLIIFFTILTVGWLIYGFSYVVKHFLGEENIVYDAHLSSLYPCVGPNSGGQNIADPIDLIAGTEKIHLCGMLETSAPIQLRFSISNVAEGFGWKFVPKTRFDAGFFCQEFNLDSGFSEGEYIVTVMSNWSFVGETEIEFVVPKRNPKYSYIPSLAITLQGRSG